MSRLAVIVGDDPEISGLNDRLLQHRTLAEIAAPAELRDVAAVEHVYQIVHFRTHAGKGRFRCAFASS